MPFNTIAIPDAASPIVIPSYPDSYPIKSPTTLVEVRTAAYSETFIIQTLAPYLIVENPNIWWSYAWFYAPNIGWYPCADDSCLGPREWYPIFSKKIGTPVTEPSYDGELKWSRKYQHVDVYVDLQNPNASRVTWN